MLFRVLVIIILLIGCSESQVTPGPQTKTIDSMTVVADFIDDSIIHGIAHFYDKNNTLVQKSDYMKGLRHGYSFTYHKNGKIYNKTFFYYGKELGFQLVYDTLGHLKYKDYYYFGKSFGPIIRYNKNQIKEYFFTDFKGETLLYTRYNAKGEVEEIRNEFDFIHLSVSDILENERSKIKLFLYTPFPPSLRFEYKIGLLDSNKKIVSAEVVGDSASVYQEQILDLPPPVMGYAIVLTFLDHRSNRTKTLIKGIEL